MQIVENDDENDDENEDCSLCSNITEISSNKWELMATTGVSNQTFSDVLNKLFKEERLSPSFSRGFLCTVCKDFVGDLDRLQHEVVAVKKWIISAFKKTKHNETKNKETVEIVPGKTKENPSPKKKQDAKVENKNKGKVKEKMKMKKTQKKTKEDVYNIESLKEKKGKNFLVRWENYPEDENTWEPRTSIPSFILKVFYLL